MRRPKRSESIDSEPGPIIASTVAVKASVTAATGIAVLCDNATESASTAEIVATVRV